MAPGDESDRSNSHKDRQNDNQGPEQNPFVHFRRAVDTMAASVFSDLAEMFPGLQKHVPPPGTNFSDSWNREAFRRFNDSYERATNPERKRIERLNRDESNDTSQQNQPRRRWGRHGDWRRNSPQVQAEETQPHQPADSLAAGVESMFESFGDLGRLVFGRDTPYDGWKPTAEYLVDSEYSPCNLEQDRHLQGQGDRWRLAFEDLLRVDNDQPMASLPTKWNPQPPSRASYVWMYSLAQKGLVEDRGTHPFLLETFGLATLKPFDLFQARIRHPLLTANFRTAQQAFFDLPEFPTKEQEASAQEYALQLAQAARTDPETELEMYERWLQHAQDPQSELRRLMASVFQGVDASGDEPETAAKAPHLPSPSPTAKSPKSDSAQSTATDQYGLGILSSLTTTERRVLPDGSILTHTTLKKKFADGREETDENTTIKQSEKSPAHSLSEEFQEPQQTRAPRRPRRIADTAKEQQRQQKQNQEAQPQMKKEGGGGGGWFWSR